MIRDILFVLKGWWHNGCGKMNLNGVNADIQLNIKHACIKPYAGIVWYDFFKTKENRGAALEIDGGSWKSFKATEMRIFADIDLSYFGKK